MMGLCSFVNFCARCLMYTTSISAGIWHLQKDPRILLSLKDVEEAT